MLKRLTGLLLVLLILTGTALAWGLLRDKQSPEVTEFQQLTEELLAQEGTLTEAERNAGWMVVKRKWASLPDNDKERLTRQKKERYATEFRQHLDRFFDLQTQEERDAFLDNDIARWEEKIAASPKKQRKRKSGQVVVKDHGVRREKLRKYLDSTEAGERAKATAYKEALLARMRDRVDK